MTVLGIESSCDETAAAVVRDHRILSNVVYSQAIHRKYGGVVPELAGREHIRRMVPIYSEALAAAGVELADIDGFAATFGPGLVGALLVGLSFAKGLAYATGKPFYAVNHLEGHLAANLVAFPDIPEKFITLLVSGGHSMLVDVNGFGHYRVLGKTLDDAAGEAFDKVAKILGLGYPGGKEIDRIASAGDPEYFHFPRALSGEDRLDFSYSGLKTAVALHVQSLNQDQLAGHKADIAASFQEAAVDMLIEKAIGAMKKTRRELLAVSGGVAANSRLRARLGAACEEIGVRLVYPPLELCTDNAAMIAAAAELHLERGEKSSLDANAVPYQKLM